MYLTHAKIYLTPNANIESSAAYLVILSVTVIFFAAIASLPNYTSPTVDIHKDIVDLSNQIDEMREFLTSVNNNNTLTQKKIDNVASSNIEIIELLKYGSAKK